MNDLYSEDQIRTVLKDTGMDNYRIDQFIKNVHSRNLRQTRTMISKYRLEVLMSVHKEQDKLYCLDYFIQQLKKAKMFESVNKEEEK